MQELWESDLLKQVKHQGVEKKKKKTWPERAMFLNMPTILYSRPPSSFVSTPNNSLVA